MALLLSPSNPRPPYNGEDVRRSAIAPQPVRAEPGRQTHFGAIHSPKSTNLLKFHPLAQDAHSIQHFSDFTEC